MVFEKEANNVIRQVLHSHAPVVRKRAPRVVCGELALQLKSAETESAKELKSAIKTRKAVPSMVTLDHKLAMRNAPVLIPAQQLRVAVMA